ncbi:MAG: Cysteine desulfurase IscS [Verrucomicrobia subdivision 3 bacterium]|nr:Cysteine desulfurase IscS [Limisphaerales bacterium]MCS1415155.1 Cysteine desulfurase IscS [Limisphaerales bacterium]
MLPYFTKDHGNAGSLHRFGRTARRAIDHAREQVAQLIHADPNEIIFTSGGTEANNMIIRGLHHKAQEPEGAILCSAIEHHSVLDVVKAQRAPGNNGLALIPTASDGQISAEVAASMLTPNIRLVSIMHANNETGVEQPIEEIVPICRDRGVHLHSDAVQSAGRIPLNVKSLPIDALTLSAHKLQGPKGIGALYLRSQARVDPLLVGGAQERRRRAGTENVAGIVGFGMACELAARNLGDFVLQTVALRDHLEQEILQRISGAWINGGNAPRLPHISNLGFQGLEGEAIMMALDAEGIAIGTGSACSSGSPDTSHVLLAMGQSHEEAQAAIRISLGSSTTQRDIDTLVQTLLEIIKRLSSRS